MSQLPGGMQGNSKTYNNIPAPQYTKSMIKDAIDTQHMLTIGYAVERVINDREGVAASDRTLESQAAGEPGVRRCGCAPRVLIAS